MNKESQIVQYIFQNRCQCHCDCQEDDLNEDDATLLVKLADAYRLSPANALTMIENLLSDELGYQAKLRSE